MRVGRVLLALGAAGLAGSAVAAAEQVSVGVSLKSASESDRIAFTAALRGRLESPEVRVVEDCDDVTFCVTAVAVPVRIGRRDGGRALACYVTRRLVVHPNWPWPAPVPEGDERPKTGVTIVDAYTAQGDVECVACERDLEALQRQVEVVRAVTAATMVDEGDLQLVVGPGTGGFLAEAAVEVARGLLERHIEPWRASRSGQ